MSIVLNWNRYIEYLKSWVDIHSDPKFTGMSPAGYDEWCDCESIEESHFKTIKQAIDVCLDLGVNFTKDTTCDGTTLAISTKPLPARLASKLCDRLNEIKGSICAWRYDNHDGRVFVVAHINITPKIQCSDM